VISYLP